MHIHKYEKAWAMLGTVCVVVFASLVAVAGFAWGFQVPSPAGRIDPAKVTTDPRFANPGLRELSPGKYEAYITAKASPWAFEPREIEVPLGSTVTFYVTSLDVEHGFNVRDSNVNMMILPGHISKLTHTFGKEGVYPFVCNEYCGVGHQNMFGTLTVVPKVGGAK